MAENFTKYSKYRQKVASGVGPQRFSYLKLEGAGGVKIRRFCKIFRKAIFCNFTIKLFCLKNILMTKNILEVF